MTKQEFVNSWTDINMKAILNNGDQCTNEFLVDEILINLGLDNVEPGQYTHKEIKTIYDKLEQVAELLYEVAEQ